MFKIPLYSSIIFFLISFSLKGQRNEIFPVGLTLNIYDNIPAIQISNNSSFWKEKISSQSQNSPVVAYNFTTALTPANSGHWRKHLNGYKTWILKISSKEAFGISILLSNVKLLQGEKLYIYNLNGVSGSFDNSIVPPSKIIPLPFLKGNEILIEYNIPIDNPTVGSFLVEKVSHAYKDIFLPDTDSNKRASQLNICHPCLEGTYWENDKRAVIRLVTFAGNETRICTGTLVNNTLQDKKPYILTAHHCISNEADANNTVFIFNYEDTFCNGIPKNLNTAFYGANYRASLYENDFSLLELYYYPPLSFHPYYAGWNISDASLDHVSCIHHPLGGLKRISISNSPVVSSTYHESGALPRTPDGFWRVHQWDLGTTEVGSSGSALFNKNHQIIGTLTGGDAACGYPYNDFFSKLSKGWDTESAIANQLKYWLDPKSEGVEELGGIEPFEGIHVGCDTISNIGPDELTTLLPYTPGFGYYSGYNSDKIATYAEKFVNKDTTLVTGAIFHIASINNQAMGGVIITVNSENKGLPDKSLYSQYIPYSKLNMFVNYVEFYPYVEVKGNFFITYTMNYSAKDTFALEQAPWGGASRNTAYMNINSLGWKPINSVHPNGWGTSLNIEAIVCEKESIPATPSLNSVKLYPNPCDEILIGELPLSIQKIKFEVFNTYGQLKFVGYNLYSDKIILNTSTFSPGIYILLITIGEELFKAKFLKK